MAKKSVYKELEQQVKDLKREALEYNRTEEALQRIADEQSILLGTIPAMIFWIDREGTFIRVNEAFANALHKSPDEIKGKSLFDLYPEDMAREYHNDNVKVMDSGAPMKHIEEPVETPNGTMWVSTDKIPYRDESGNIIGIIGFSENITERKRTEEELRKAHDEMEKRVEERTEELLKANEQLSEK